jgi:hypothetical protein
VEHPADHQPPAKRTRQSSPDALDSKLYGNTHRLRSNKVGTEFLLRTKHGEINSETTTGFFDTYSSLNASCIMIYDSTTNRFVSNLGYVSVDLPRRGSVARWDGYTARYIGW